MGLTTDEIVMAGVYGVVGVIIVILGLFFPDKYTLISPLIIGIIILTSMAVLMEKEADDGKIVTKNALSYGALLFAFIMLVWFTVLNWGYLFNGTGKTKARVQRVVEEVIPENIQKKIAGIKNKMVKEVKDVVKAAFGKGIRKRR